MKKIFFFLMTLSVTNAFSQRDSLKNVLRLDDYFSLVLMNHPVVKQARLLEESANANLMQARGNFDPKVDLNYRLKNFKETEYYDILSSSLNFPNRIPITPKISVDRNQGSFLNPESTIPSDNNDLQISAGISVPIGKGLFIDERRLALKQAQIYQDIAAAEQLKLVNKVLLKSLKDYWEWYAAYRKLLLLRRSADIASELFRRVKIDYGFGEAAVIDTIQAHITYQTRLADLDKVTYELINSRLMLSTHLWSEELEPLEVLETINPDTLASFGTIPNDEEIANLVDNAMEYHPDIVKIDGKSRQLANERYWNIESLKPQLDLNYSLIDSPINPFGEFSSPSFTNNYNLGVDFSIPILLRKERGKLQMTNLKIAENTYYMSESQLTIKNTILSRYAEIKMSASLASRYENMAQSYERLVQAELINLENGESDLFKINIQQDKLIESQIKYLDNRIKFEKNKAEILYDAGVPYLNIPF